MKIELPASWESITLRDYQAITALFKESKEKGEGLSGKDKELHDYHTECALISLLSNVDMDDVLALHRSAHTRLMNVLGFLSEPITGEVKTRIKINGNRYYFEKDATKITGGQWVSIMHFLEDDTKIDANLHNLLACFASRYKWFKADYNGKIHKEVATDMLDIPITVVKPLTDFFLKDWLKYVKNIAVYLEITGKILKRKAERQLARSKRDTVGSTQ